MKNYVVYNKLTGEILRTGICSDESIELQALDKETVIEGIANDITQKIVDGIIIDKSPDEISKQKIKRIPHEKQRANITNEQLQSILDRLTILEAKQKM